MIEINEYQAFMKVTRPDDMPTQEAMVFLTQLVSAVKELQQQIDDHETRLTGGGL